MDSLRTIANLVLRKIIGSIYFLDSHFTYLAILLITVIGTVIFFLFGYIGRYNRYDYWKWKTRALYKSIRLSIFLILLKGALKAIL